jgi:hypothetical protein
MAGALKIFMKNVMAKALLSASSKSRTALVLVDLLLLNGEA